MKWLLSLFLIVSGNVFAEPEIPTMYKTVAQEQRVPAKLFYALILNESRSLTSSDDKVKTLPWPWTVNHRGRAHYFETRARAYQFARSLVEKKDLSFDVGLGQINWRWHKGKFASLWSAFDPYINLTVSARYLREQYNRDECNRWELAIGCYHRPGQRTQDKQLAQNYTRRVIKLWKQI